MIPIGVALREKNASRFTGIGPRLKSRGLGEGLQESAIRSKRVFHVVSLFLRVFLAGGALVSMLSKANVKVATTESTALWRNAFPHSV